MATIFLSFGTSGYSSNTCTCEKRDTSRFLKLIQQGVLEECVNDHSTFGCVHCTGKHKDTPLILAVRHGHLHVVKKLCVDFGAPLETPNSDGKRPLHEAAQSGHVECAKFLLLQRAEVDPLKRADWSVGAPPACQ